MKKKKSSLLCVLLSLMMLVIMIPAETMSVSAATLTTSSGQVKNSNGADQIKGVEDGYSYELWNQNDQGTAEMKLGSGGAFSCKWTGIQNVLFRRGVDFDCTKTYKELGNISIEYEADYNIPSSENSYLCVYGWTKSPLIEYYIVDSWGSWRPPGGQGYKGTVTVDGGEYDVYMVDHDGPSIEQGVTHFTQCWSVRKVKRSSGTISVSQHFAEWEKLGMKTGKLYEAALNVEGYMSNGQANVKKNVVSVGGEIKEPEPVKPVEPDANGYYFHSTFENGSDNWEARGDGSAKATVSSSAAYEGTKSMSVTGRTDAWNGTALSLSTSTFVPGQSYSFSAIAMQDKVASDDFKLTLQYSDGSKENYDTIAEATGAKGEWVQLANKSYTIPKGASNMILYVETADSTTDFYVDECIGAKDGTVIKGPSGSTTPTDPPASGLLPGDVNVDKKVDASDVAELQKFIVKKVTTLKSAESADLNNDGKVNVFDLVILKKKVKGGSTTNPPATTTTTKPNNPTTTTTAGGGSSITPSEYMENVRKTVTAQVPGNVTQGNFGTVKAIQYPSSSAGGRMKKANVLLPDGYSENEKYPVMYCLHGIFGDENSMLGMSVPSIAGNLMKSGEAEKMIIVFPQMYTSASSDAPQGMNITLEVTQNYDKFLDDLTKDLMPYIEKNFSVKTGRENTAISGFSMGGRESLYIGVSRPDLIGYIGAACPAPGVTPGKDMFLDHPGNMPESDFKIKDSANKPYLFMITGGTNDGVVGTFPQQYHEILTRNGEDHIWQEIPGGGHDNSCVTPLMYNFIRNIFKTGKSSGGGNSTPATTTTTTTQSGGVDPTKPMIAISFDDGTNPYGKRIIDALAKENFHATFFYVGDWIKDSSQVKYAYEKGMEVANHTMSHPNLTQKSAAEIQNEYNSCAQKLKGIIGTDPSPLMRLPYLASNNTVTSALPNAPLISCAIDTQDWNGASKDQIVNTVKQAMSNGSGRNAIVLCHETYESTASAIEELAPYIKAQGWQIVTISEMFAANGKKLNGGQVYTKCQ